MRTRWRDKDSTATKRREALRKEENRSARSQKPEEIAAATDAFLNSQSSKSQKAQRHAVRHNVSASHREILWISDVPDKYKPKQNIQIKGNPFELLVAPKSTATVESVKPAESDTKQQSESEIAKTSADQLSQGKNKRNRKRKHTSVSQTADTAE
jgi:hypothetical protein